MGGGVFVDAVVGVGVVRASFLFGAGNAVEEVDVGVLGQIHGVADALGHFALDALPAGRFRGAGLGLTHLFLPFALHLVHFAFFLAFSGFGEGRRRGRVYQETLGNARGINAVDLGLWERNEVGNEFVRVTGIVDGAGEIVFAIALVRIMAIRLGVGVVAGLVRSRLLGRRGKRECSVSLFLCRKVICTLWLTTGRRRRRRIVGQSTAHLLRRWRKCRC